MGPMEQAIVILVVAVVLISWSILILALCLWMSSRPHEEKFHYVEAPDEINAAVRELLEAHNREVDTLIDMFRSAPKEPVTKWRGRDQR
jgi:hypothetical protein